MWRYIFIEEKRRKCANLNGDLTTMVEISRNMMMSTCNFTDCFKGFDKVGAVQCILGAETEDVLARLRVEFTNTTDYMGVDDFEGHLLINPHYLATGDFTDVYLDVIHELVHVKQFLEGKNSDKKQNYVERPLEIEAYQTAVHEARALGLDENRIFDYLDSDLINDQELAKLAQRLDVKIGVF